MIRLQQPPLLPSSKPMSVEIDVLPQEKYYIDLRVRYFIDNCTVFLHRDLGEFTNIVTPASSRGEFSVKAVFPWHFTTIYGWGTMLVNRGGS